MGPACGDDGPSSLTDAAPVDAGIDGSIADAGPPDAFDPCPGEITFQVRVADWSSDENLFGVVVQEGDTANMATSAPNGRVVLCIGQSGPVTLNFSHSSYLDRVHTTTGEIAAAHFAAGPGPTFRLLSTAQEATLYASAAITREGTATTAIAMVSGRQSGADAAGAALVLGATNEGAFTPGGDVDTLVAGATTTADGRVLFLNAATDPATSSLQVSGLANCSFPAAMSLAPGGVSSVSIVCDP
jgi:hypothetical protein